MWMELRAHKKYFCVHRDYPDHAHVTVDDDIYYPKFLLSALQEGHSNIRDVVSGAVFCLWLLVFLIQSSNGF